MNPPLLLGDAVILVARLGGYIARSNDSPPGHEVMWQGYSYLQLMSEGYELRDGEDSSASLMGKGQS